MTNEEIEVEFKENEEKLVDLEISLSFIDEELTENDSSLPTCWREGELEAYKVFVEDSICDLKNEPRKHTLYKGVMK